MPLLQAKLLAPLVVAATLAPFLDRNEDACRSNAKMLAVGAMMYTADWDEVLPLASRYRASAMPYVRDAKAFHCPADLPGATSYSLDPRVSGRRLATIPNPAKTALLVEGTPKKAAFRHQGKAALVYVDGHAKMSPPAGRPSKRGRSPKVTPRPPPLSPRERGPDEKESGRPAGSPLPCVTISPRGVAGVKGRSRPPPPGPATRRGSTTTMGLMSRRVSGSGRKYQAVATCDQACNIQGLLTTRQITSMRPSF